MVPQTTSNKCCSLVPRHPTRGQQAFRDSVSARLRLVMDRQRAREGWLTTYHRRRFVPARQSVRQGKGARVGENRRNGGSWYLPHIFGAPHHTISCQSFSKMWVEFLLKEAAQGTTPTNYTPSPTPTTGRNSLPSSPLFSPGGSPYQKLGRMPSYNGSSLPQRSSIDHPGPHTPNSHSQPSQLREAP
jgi:hypothetical protein